MKEFQPLANLLAAALPSAGDIPAPDSVQRELARCWREQAGAAAVHSRPLLFASGRLAVFVESAAWGTEIRHRAQRLREGLTEKGLDLNVVEVKVLPDAPAVPAPKSGPRKSAIRLSPQNAEQIVQMAETIGHPQLRESLLRLAKRADKE